MKVKSTLDSSSSKVVSLSRLQAELKLSAMLEDKDNFVFILVSNKAGEPKYCLEVDTDLISGKRTYRGQSFIEEVKSE